MLLFIFLPMHLQYFHVVCTPGTRTLIIAACYSFFKFIDLFFSHILMSSCVLSSLFATWCVCHPLSVYVLIAWLHSAHGCLATRSHRNCAAPLRSRRWQGRQGYGKKMKENKEITFTHTHSHFWLAWLFGGSTMWPLRIVLTVVLLVHVSWDLARAVLYLISLFMFLLWVSPSRGAQGMEVRWNKVKKYKKVYSF